MSITRHLFPGGNTCYGFYSFYDHIVSPDVSRKFVIKGGPGVGKSTFMKKLGAAFSNQGYDVEYHWCSSDNKSLDGIVIGEQQICFLDGTAPHVVDPRFPGAVDEIINLGQFWKREKITSNRDSIEKLTQDISQCFNRAYLRLKEANIAYSEWKSYFNEASDLTAINRNIVALSSDFLQGAVSSSKKTRHLFPGAITPEGLITKIDSLINENAALFAVKGSPGSGIKQLFAYTLTLLEVNNIYAEVYHNPFNPDEIDIILLPKANRVLIDISSTIFNYTDLLPTNKYKRLLDFDQFIKSSIIDQYAKLIDMAQNRFDSGISDAVAFINTAKKYHDQLEAFYIPAMDFDSINQYRDELYQQIISSL